MISPQKPPITVTLEIAWYGLRHWVGVIALLTAGLFINEPPRSAILVAIMLYYPLIVDQQTSISRTGIATEHRAAKLLMIALLAILLAWQPDVIRFSLATLFLAALPEEWFFRAYFMVRTGTGWRANILTTLVFATLHWVTRDITAAALVVVPSLFYGWLFQKTRDVSLLVLVHALSNVFYVMFLAPHFV